ncbi:hypothetical protein LTR78_000714 [Recurvomyces mirabilis]|uniref:Uncharacterized protein n=1 Tax=Recurvomyces mirabilis TaxID=574656 RepID=A0AAE0WWG6_9PEZI|nr:hypothetical protein LTR78_000714 [Recurvomyces mirabilis]KAK5158684.1 hypothetical protein LTS14_002792 [Recurvomyces mirabilis]
MSRRELFHLRKQLCAFQRQLLTRPYTSEAQPPTSISLAPDPVRFLQAADQAALRLARQRLESVVDHAKHTTEQVSAFPTALQIPITTRKPGVNHASEDPYETTLTPYQMGSLRARQQEQPAALDNLLKQADHIDKHLQDLQLLPYTTSSAEPTNPAFTKWQQGIIKMSTEERNLALKELSYEEQAKRSRLMGDSKRLVEIVKEVEAASRKYGGPVGVDAPTKAENPFAAGTAHAGSGNRQSTSAKAGTADPAERKGSSTGELKQNLAKKFPGSTTGSEQKVETTTATPPPRRSTAQTLLDLQRSLAESLKGGK